ncbi:MAG: DNA polymerase III subunit tau [Candidatus Anoxychlamydiales bacterium]|nr:DNA polymerase III subunit tau [Candidatus Anoxychlamydiales bacterium]
MTVKYQILARQYRPQTFNEVISQKSIVTTIKNAISQNKVASAYMFSGSRGTGKTTLARLFAKALNCKSPINQEPCNKCSSCLEISSSRSLDVIEIDGASNRGIDDIRQINDTIGYAPANRYKIYIIDEVHMLTKEAFNALLKTLEEPPNNIKFFFATTEANKVLPTILSRCQRFELKRISHEDIINKLRQISNDLNRDIEDAALHIIANFSEGSLRDAESLLDQMFCFKEGKILLDHINESIGFVSKDYFFKLDEAIKNVDINFAFYFIDNIYKAGKDLSYLIEELIEHFRNILVVKLKDSSLLETFDEEKKKYENSASYYSEEMLFYILDLLIKNIQNNHKSIHKKINLEMLLLNIIKSKKRISIDILVKRLIDLENKANTSTNENIPNKETSPIEPKKQVEVNKKEEIQLSSITQNKNIEESIKEEKKIKLEKIEFSLSEKNKKTDSPISISPIQTINVARHDTIMKFMQVELNAIIKKG